MKYSHVVKVAESQGYPGEVEQAQAEGRDRKPR